MSYEIQAVIGRADNLGGVVAILPASDPVDLHQGFVLVPVPNDPREDDEGIVEPFAFLTSRLEASLREASRSEGLAYVEAEFFGGSGFQTAAVWSKGQLLYQPETMNPKSSASLEDAPINHALRAIGVQRDERGDEFATVGLDRYRHTEDWVQLPPLLRELPITTLVWKARRGEPGVYSTTVSDHILVLSREASPGHAYVVRAHQDPLLTLQDLPALWQLES